MYSRFRLEAESPSTAVGDTSGASRSTRFARDLALNPRYPEIRLSGLNTLVAADSTLRAADSWAAGHNHIPMPARNLSPVRYMAVVEIFWMPCTAA